MVVIIHGLMGSPRQFDFISEAAQISGYSVTAPTLPGHGGTIREFSESKFEQWQEHVDTEVERLIRDFESIWLVGHSIGGLLALNASARFNRHVRGVFTIACPFEFARFSVKLVRARLLQIFSSKIRSEYISSNSIPTSPSLIWRIRKPVAEVKKLVLSTRENLPRVHAPVMAVYSSFDEVTSIRSIDIQKTALSNTHFEYMLLNESLHAYYTNHERLMITDALLKFLALT